jgi:hypothetical protein
MSITPGKRESLLDRDKGRCRYCGDPYFNIDHVIPRSKHGNDDLGNLVLACEPCNGYKKSKSCFEAGMTMLKPGTILSPEEAAARRKEFKRLCNLSTQSRREKMKHLGGYIPQHRDTTNQPTKITRVAIVTGTRS